MSVMRRIGTLCAVALAVALACGSSCYTGPRMPTGGPAMERVGKIEPFVHPLGMRFVRIPAGVSEGGISDIEMRRPLLVSACEITNAQFEKFNPKHVRSKVSPTDDHPVNEVSAKDAEDFCKWLTTNDEKGRRYRLPTSAEWEYIARGGHSYTVYPWGSEIDKTRACYGATGPMPVGCYAPNDYGVYDIVGNVAEWVRADMGGYMVRGGSWRDKNPASLAVGAPGEFPDEKEALDHEGFRVICDPPLIP